MKLYVPLFAMLLAVPAFAQDETGTPSGNRDTTMDSEMSTRLGTSFYSDEGMTTLRTADEIKTLWTSISAEDQTALRARCEAMGTVSAEGSGDGTASSSGTEADATGSENANDADAITPAEDPGFFGDDTRMSSVCEAIAGL